MRFLLLLFVRRYVGFSFVVEKVNLNNFSQLLLLLRLELFKGLHFAFFPFLSWDESFTLSISVQSGAHKNSACNVSPTN